VTFWKLFILEGFNIQGVQLGAMKNEDRYFLVFVAAASSWIRWKKVL
jgi:hypothetical protein